MRHRVRQLACIALASAMTPLISVNAASAASLSAPAHVREVAATTSSVAITQARSAAASGYRIWLSPNKADIYYANLAHAAKARRTVTSSSPTLVVKGLPHTAAPYWYRVAVVRGSGYRVSPISAAYVAPATPTALRAATVHGVPVLTWNASSAVTFQVAQATNPAMTSGRADYTISAATGHVYTATGTRAGLTYYFRVRAVNGEARSSYSAQVRTLSSVHQDALRVATYNLLESTFDGTLESGNRVAAWSQRQPAAASLIRGINPDVLDVQEGAAWIGPVHGFGGERQVDGLTHTLGGTYALARTEVPPTEHGYFRTGNYILYKPAMFTAVGPGGHWNIGQTATAAYQVLSSRATGAKLLVISPHLAVTASRAGDLTREQQTTSLVTQAATYAQARQVSSIIYGGDYNSYPDAKHHPLDGPGVVMQVHHNADAYGSAHTFTNRQYDSANLYLRKPQRFAHSIDHIYVSPGVGVLHWGVAMNLVRGNIVGVIPSDHNLVYADLTVPV